MVVLSAEEFALALNGASKANFSRSMTAEEGRRLGLETELSESLVDAVYADSTIPKQEQRQTEALIYNVADTNSEALYQIADELGLDYTRFATPTQTAENGNQYFGKTEDGNWLSYATEEEQSAAYDRGEISQTTNRRRKQMLLLSLRPLQKRPMLVLRLSAPVVKIACNVAKSCGPPQGQPY